MRKFLFFICLFCMLIINSFGNAIVISNLSSVSGPGYVQLKFDLTWDNSWRNSINYDAAWVFFKWKDNDGIWKHLNLTNANNNINPGFTISIPADLTGAMIYRSSTGFGTTGITGITLGVNNYPGSFDIKAFALEMVAIPMGDAYSLGDGEAGTYYSTALTGLPYRVNSPSITMGSTTGLLYDGISNGVLSNGFPVGFGYFGTLYMMKHELSQAAYRDFLNTLTYMQQTTRTAISPSSATGSEAIGSLISRNSIQIVTPGIANAVPAVYGCNLNNNSLFNEPNDGEWIACNNLSWMDLAAYLDWAALRPMTEMEFEKSCRGPIAPIAGENAAGTVAAATYNYPINSPGTANESVSYSGSVLLGNFNYISTTPNSPMRVGIHATPGANRISAGAGYYGCLDLSGNIAEYTVTTGNAAGRSFTGLDGDGMLTASGDANVDYWPGINGNTTITVANTPFAGIGVTGSAGFIERGGGFYYTGNNSLKVSYRIAGTGSTSRGIASGGRGVKLL